MATAVHLSINSSEITVVSNLNKAYSSEGVPTLNVASKLRTTMISRCTIVEKSKRRDV